jgi:hypothetical protein
MEWAINLKISVTYARMVMSVLLLGKASKLCSKHHVQQADGVVQALKLMPLLKFVMQVTSAQLVQRCKYPVPQADIIQV